MIQRMNSVLIRKKQMRIKGNRKNHEHSRKPGCEITHCCAMKRRHCSASFVGNLRRQTPLHRQKGDTLMFGLEPTKELVYVRLPVINKGIAVFKEMPKWNSAVKHFEEEEKSLHTNDLTFLVCIPFLLLQGSGKKKSFCWLACMNVKKKMLNKNQFVCPPKNKNVPQNVCQGDKLSP